MFILTIIIAIFSFVFIKKCLNQSNETDKYSTNNARNHPTTTSRIQHQNIPHISYWESWKTCNSQKAKAIESSITDRDISKLPDSEVKEIIGSFAKMSNANNLTDWMLIKSTTLEKLTQMFDDLGEKTTFSMLENAIEEEVAYTHFRRENTAVYLGLTWLKGSIEKVPNTKTFSSHASIVSAKCSYLSSKNSTNNSLTETEKEEILNSFKNEYTEQLEKAIGDNANIPLFCEGYDSPIAREIMHVMYSYLRNPVFVNKAKNDGLWKKFVNMIIEVTNFYTDKYCDADLQECIEYYNFPDKPVETSQRCPNCGNRKISNGLLDNQFECFECGYEWFAKYGRNLYL